MMLAFLLGDAMQKRDELIDQLIKPPRVRFSGFDWQQPAAKLQPTGAAETHKQLSARLSRERE